VPPAPSSTTNPTTNLETILNADQTIEVRLLVAPDEFRRADRLLDEIWGTVTAPVELMVALAHAGGYVAGAFDAGGLVGTSIGFLADHRGRPALHSHVTGVAPGTRGTGVGRALKLHQRTWAAERGLDWITWTFDPLVRRNAWFNLAVLGARVHEYLPEFYGPMDDVINAGDASDRLLVAWDVTAAGADPADGDGVMVPHDASFVPTPPDIVELRRSDPRTAARWRLDVRHALGGALDDGRRVLGFTRDGDYVIGSNHEQ
jgi:predicted GNAT superfamily acetyltransferase